MRWIVDDSGRVAALNFHPATLWAHECEFPIKEILDLGFICIEDRRKALILALDTSKVQPTTLAGAFYFLAEHDADRIIIYADCGTESADCTIVKDIGAAYRLIEEMVRSTPSVIRSTERHLQSEIAQYPRPISRAVRPSHLKLVDMEQPILG